MAMAGIIAIAGRSGKLSRAPRREDVGLQQDQHAHQQRQGEAVPEDVAQDRARWRVRPVATLATTMLWASIILPITPPELLAAAVRTGETPICSAVTFCRLPNSTFEEVSLPVSATPSQPSSGEKNGNSTPVLAKARPMVASEPE